MQKAKASEYKIRQQQEHIAKDNELLLKKLVEISSGRRSTISTTYVNPTVHIRPKAISPPANHMLVAGGKQLNGDDRGVNSHKNFDIN